MVYSVLLLNQRWRAEHRDIYRFEFETSVWDLLDAKGELADSICELTDYKCPDRLYTPFCGGKKGEKYLHLNIYNHCKSLTMQATWLKLFTGWILFFFLCHGTLHMGEGRIHSCSSSSMWAFWDPVPWMRVLWWIFEGVLAPTSRTSPKFGAST